jgi:hypothetical protein
MKLSKSAHTQIVKLKCPLCGSLIRLSRVERHRNRHHPESSLKVLQAKIRAALENGTLDYSIIQFDGATPMRSSTEAFEAGRKKGYTGPPLRGGAIELGKKK